MGENEGMQKIGNGKTTVFATWIEVTRTAEVSAECILRHLSPVIQKEKLDEVSKILGINLTDRYTIKLVPRFLSSRSPRFHAITYLKGKLRGCFTSVNAEDYRQIRKEKDEEYRQTHKEVPSRFR